MAFLATLRDLLQSADAHPEQHASQESSSGAGQQAEGAVLLCGRPGNQSQSSQEEPVFSEASGAQTVGEDAAKASIQVRAESGLC